MGPLIPQGIISGELNFFFAFIIGVAFGFILEQAGFSSSRKLAGVFYGYDFVVLKVFFTAGVTAAVGLFFFKYLGWIDIDFVYVNPMYLYSAIVGGVIMGFGFILGGFCPGTGFAAAVIGKIDAIVFIGGIFLGVFIFGYFFDFFEPLYNSNYLGNLLVHDSLGISQKWFLFILISVAVVAFAVTQEIQNSSSKFKELINNTQKISITFPLMLLFILAFIALFLPQQRKTYITEISKNEMIDRINNKEYSVTPIKLAYVLINDTKEYKIIDVRTKEEFENFHLPGAIHIGFENILNKAYRHLLVNTNKTLLYSNSGEKSEMSWFLLTRFGLGEFYVLDGGLNAFFSTIFAGTDESENLAIKEAGEIKFIEGVRFFFSEGEMYKRKHTDSKIPEVKEKIAPAKGGC